MIRAITATAALFLAGAVFAFPKTGNAQSELRLGAFMPATGVTADVGAQIRAGIEVAVAEANAEGEHAQQPYHVRVLWYDTEGKGDVGLNAVDRALTVEKIDAGIGFLSSDVFVRVMREFQKAGVPVIDCCAAALQIGDAVAKEKMTYVFQLSPTVKDIASSVAAAVAEWVKPARVGLLNENTDAGRGFSQITRAWFAAHDPAVQVVADEFVDHGASDLTAPLLKLKRLGAQAIIGEIYGSSASLLYEQWYELRVPAVIAHMGATVSADTFIKPNAKQMADSLLNNRWWPSPYTPLSEPMAAAYTKLTRHAPTNFSIQAYDAAVVAIDAFRKAGTRDGSRMAAVLASTTFETAWGEQAFTPLADGHRMPIETVVVQVQQGKKVPIYPPGVAKANHGIYQSVPPYAWQKR